MAELIVESNEALMTRLNSEKEGLALWSEQKKNEYTELFNARSRAAKYIQWKAAHKIEEIALRRKFLSVKHVNQFEKDFQLATPQMDPDTRNENNSYRYHQSGMYGGRQIAELDEIAEKLATELLGSMPSLKTAVKVISPETAKQIDQKEKLTEQGQALADEFSGLVSRINMADAEFASMRVSEFIAFCEEREDKRAELVKKMDKVGQEIQDLEDSINKMLYGGLPGLTDAVLKLIKHQLDRAKALSENARRVEEFVKFGDIQSMTDMLAQFDKDELKVEAEVKDEFADAMAKLKKAAKDGLKLTAATPAQLRR